MTKKIIFFFIYGGKMQDNLGNLGWVKVLRWN